MADSIVSLDCAVVPDAAMTFVQKHIAGQAQG